MSQGRGRRELLAGVLRAHHEQILGAWVRFQADEGVSRPGLTEDQVRQEAESVLLALSEAVGGDLPESAAVARPPLGNELATMARSRARAGVPATAASASVLRLKDILLDVLREEAGDDSALLELFRVASGFVDAAAIVTFQSYLEGRDEIIRRQSAEMLELATPVVQLWHRVLAVPLVGTLDSSRAQMVMESLLEGIQRHEASVAILDITGVPTVDTVVAQHLMQTVAAARLMGADCVISGIRPPIAQTMAQLGIGLSAIVTKATLADALSAAIAMVPESSDDAGSASLAAAQA
jgi:rsbT co-antagonist protein RsbR